jgi:hypothetical protein
MITNSSNKVRINRSVERITKGFLLLTWVNSVVYYQSQADNSIKNKDRVCSLPAPQSLPILLTGGGLQMTQ